LKLTPKIPAFDCGRCRPAGRLAHRDGAGLSGASHHRDCSVRRGGPTDTINRVLIERMAAYLRQAIVIENVGGADGTIAVGHTLAPDPTVTPLPLVAYRLTS
jgi:hypothetical protein